LLGLERALPFLLEGTKVTAAEALTAGLIHETVETVDQLIPRAKAWILENRDNESASIQPWDVKGYKIPGGGVSSPKVAQLIGMAPPMLWSKTRGLLPAPEQILDCAVEAARLDFATAERVESRGLAYLVTTPEAKNMISTFFFGMNKLNSGASRPPGQPRHKASRIAVLGAGMMGQGIAYAAAMAGVDVVLKDVSIEIADKGKAYSEKLLARRVASGKMDETGLLAVLDRIHPSASNADFQGCDLIIEAVFEDVELKQQLTASLESGLANNGIWASSTSTLSITGLSEASKRPENFIGMHFFSPVDKMPLVEIICGDKTSEHALAKAFDFVQQLGKTPIVVNDSPGFYASRAITTYIDEGIRLLTEGMHPIRVDNLAQAVGMPVGPLQLHDEPRIELARNILETWDEMGIGDKWREQDALHKPEIVIEEQDVKDRLLFRQVIESLKCLEEDVLRSALDGNIGSIMGIGAPVWTGGFIQFVNTYGLERFAARCVELAEKYGDRFTCPAIVSTKIACGGVRID
jgi:3-hydroxyacyl-CoA dehydrogenase/enoyl-CoA hydratase/3-hydroxybutyryl-CoA epimerase